MKSIIGDGLWAEMTEGQKIDAVLKGHATLTQMSEGLLDGSEKLRDACREFLADADTSFENLLTNNGPGDELNTISAPGDDSLSQRGPTKPTRAAAPQLKPRFGLPEGFEPRRQRYGRSVLLELNIYRLPNSREFIPCHPSGTLGTRRHLYALLTTEQYLKGRRGSVYIRTDGRIFDYSVDRANPSGDLFDTGYTIYDLERTGAYAPPLPRRRKKSQPVKVKRAAAGR